MTACILSVLTIFVKISLKLKLCNNNYETLVRFFKIATVLNLGIFQEPVLFSGSIEENIAYGWRSENGPLEFQHVLDAATQANALEFIHSFPQGFSTVVGEKGQSLSGK